MGVKVKNTSYTSNLTGTSPSYVSTPAELIILRADIETNVRVLESNSISITPNFVDNQIEIAGFDFLQEGFRNADKVTWTLYNKADGSVNMTAILFIDYVTASVMRFTAPLPTFPDNQDTVQELVADRTQDYLEFNLNHISSEVAESADSMIDGEVTRIIFDGLDAINVNGSKNGVKVGNQSGQYVLSASIQRFADANKSRQYRLEATFFNSGIYRQDWFAEGRNIKLSCYYKFKIFSYDVSSSSIVNVTQDAGTVWFNSAFGSAPNSTLIQGATYIDYAKPSDFTFVVQYAGSAPDMRIGASYIPQDDNYYKNKPQEQYKLGLLLDSHLAFGLFTFTDFTNSYELTINSITSVGGVHTIGCTFTPYASFTTLMESRDADDRLFYVWINAGNVNHLVFSGQLEDRIDVTAELKPDVITIQRHDDNDYEAAQIVVDKVNVQDDIALYSVFDLPPNTTYNSLFVGAIVKNTVTDDYFYLQSTGFDFSAYQINSAGQYLIDDTRDVNGSLPTNSSKRIVKFVNDTATNKATIYYPLIVGYKHWLAQPNTPADFYPNQNRKWLNYQKDDWKVFLRVSLENETAYIADIELPIYDYDEGNEIVSEIILQNSNGVNVTTVFENEIMTVKCRHTLVNDDIVTAWAEISYNPFEAGDEKIISTKFDHIDDLNNPLIPVEGQSRATITYLAPNIIEVTCRLDSSRMPNINKGTLTGKVFINEMVRTGDEGDVITEDGLPMIWEYADFIAWENE